MEIFSFLANTYCFLLDRFRRGPDSLVTNLPINLYRSKKIDVDARKIDPGWKKRFRGTVWGLFLVGSPFLPSIPYVKLISGKRRENGKTIAIFSWYGKKAMGLSGCKHDQTRINQMINGAIKNPARIGLYIVYFAKHRSGKERGERSGFSSSFPL